jgi:hypothetical protein
VTADVPRPTLQGGTCPSCASHARTAPAPNTPTAGLPAGLAGRTPSNPRGVLNCARTRKEPLKETLKRFSGGKLEMVSVS